MKIAFKQAAAAEPRLPDKLISQKLLREEIINVKDKSLLILIKASRFVYGSDIIGEVHYTSPVEKEIDSFQAATGKKRTTYIELPSFYLDAFEITNQQFSVFLRETGTKPHPALELGRSSKTARKYGELSTSRSVLQMGREETSH